jgi:hypothetical protein
MRKTIVFTLSTVLMAGSMVQVATASEHHVRKTSAFRGAYNQWNGTSYVGPLTSQEKRNLEDLGFSGRDPSRVGGEDPWLKPSGS